MMKFALASIEKIREPSTTNVEFVKDVGTAQGIACRDVVQRHGELARARPEPVGDDADRRTVFE